MSRISPEAVKNFHERLAEFKRSNQASLSARDVLARSMKKIEEARQYGASWDVIAEILGESIRSEGMVDFKISGKTVQAYYSEIQKQKKEVPLRQKGSRSLSKSKPHMDDRDSTNAENLSLISATFNSNGNGLSPSSQVDEADTVSTDNPPVVENALHREGSLNDWQEPTFNVNRVRPTSTNS